MNKVLKRALWLTILLVFCTGWIWSNISQEERAALIAIYKAANGDGWKNNAGWKNNNPAEDGFSQSGTEGTWNGITIENDHVKHIKLESNWLSGTLSPQVGNLKYLETLSLTFNQLSGIIPSELGNSTNLKTLYLRFNNFSGSIPQELSNLSGLTLIDLQSNHLSGSIPPQFGNMSNLSTLYLDSNELSGPIPSSLGKCSGLQNFTAENNSLSGSIPPELGNLTKLTKLRLNGNSLSGSIPPELGNLSNLQILTLNSNKLSGTIPSQLGNLSKLIYLDLQHNTLSGSIPSELGNLANLTDLWLNQNCLEGSIPTVLGNLSNLKCFDCSSNKLSGSIPRELGNLTKLLTLRMSNNQLSEGIPSELGNLTKLNVFVLSENKLTGSIPKEFGNFANIGMFIISHNQLSGSIPAELGSMSSGSYMDSFDISSNTLTGEIPSEVVKIRAGTFDLSNNQLSGTIPTQLGSTSVSRYCYFSNNNLTGSIPTELGNTGAELIDLSNNNLSGAIPSEIGNASKTVFFLTSNALSGKIPSQVTNTAGIFISYNSLYSNDSSVISFVSQSEPYWASTQTIQPENLSLAVLTNSSVRVSWTPILYMNDNGGYYIYYTLDPSGQWTLAGNTQNKKATFFDVTGLSTGQAYYFKIQTRTSSHGNNKNALSSDFTSNSSIVVSGAPTITIDKTEFRFDGVIGAPAPPAQTFTIIYSGGTFQWTALANQSWIKITPASGGSGTKVNVSVDITNLSEGSYSGSIIVTPQGVGVNPITLPVKLVLTAAGNSPAIVLNRYSFLFGATKGKTVPPEQSFIISNSGQGTLEWSIVSNANWVKVTPASGKGNGIVQIRVDPSGLDTGSYETSLSVSAVDAVNSPQTISIRLTVKNKNDDQTPLGSFDTPTNNASVYGSLAVTGWAVDDTGIESVKIYRDAVAGEPSGMVFIGNAVSVEGARPDIETAYADYPAAYKAGWGYMLLTYFLPEKGNGTFVLHAVAIDIAGHETLLGSKRIKCDNANSTNPFGTIDTPEQGGIASGKEYLNYGWTLTPLPNTINKNGKSITIWVDGKALGHPVYNQYREDIERFFPGFNNSGGAAGYFYMNTESLTTGIHTISWSVVDNEGNAEGIGSRYFSVLNTGATTKSQTSLSMSMEMNNFPETHSIDVYKGFNLSSGKTVIVPDSNGVFYIQIEETNRVEIHFPSAISLLSTLPVGSSLESNEGIFYWQPGPGFIGTYRFEFIRTVRNNKIKKSIVEIEILPRFKKN